MIWAFEVNVEKKLTYNAKQKSRCGTWETDGSPDTARFGHRLMVSLSSRTIFRNKTYCLMGPCFSPKSIKLQNTKYI